MYNEALKTKFILEFDRSSMRTYYRLMFERTSTYEESIGCDLSAMEESSLAEVVNNLAGTSSSGNTNLIYTVKRYIRWARKIGSDEELGIKIEPRNIVKVKDRLFMSPEEFAATIDGLFHKPSCRDTDILYRTYLWLGFIGIDGRVAYDVKDSDISFSNGTITKSGVEFRIPDEAKEDIRYAASVRQFIMVRYVPKSDAYVETYRERCAGHEILRGVSTRIDLKDQVATSFKSVISKRIKGTLPNGEKPKELSYERAYLSGVLYRAHERELKGLDPGFETVVDREMKIGTKADKDAQHARWIAIDAYNKDYENWKLAFYPTTK